MERKGVHLQCLRFRVSDSLNKLSQPTESNIYLFLSLAAHSAHNCIIVHLARHYKLNWSSFSIHCDHWRVSQDVKMFSCLKLTYLQLLMAFCCFYDVVFQQYRQGDSLSSTEFLLIRWIFEVIVHRLLTWRVCW